MDNKILLTYDYGKENIYKIKELGYEILLRKEEGLLVDEEMEECNILICYNPFKTLEIQRLKALKWIQLSSIGIDQLVGKENYLKGVILTNNRGGYSIPMGEWIVMQLLQFYKHSYELYENQLKNKWKMDTGIMELYGKTIGFLGTGTIAIESAKRLEAFGVTLLGYNSSKKQVPYFHRCYDSSNLNEMLKACDAVVVALPLTEKTYNFVSRDLFENMKEGTFLINISRGEVVNLKDLLEEIDAGKISKAALDVFSKEPLEEDSPLWQNPNVIVTPHNSWVSEKRNNRRFELIYDNLKRYIKGESLLNVVDIKRGY